MQRNLLFASSLLLASALCAQTPPCLSYNDTTTNSSTSLTSSPFVGLNPNWRAYQFSPTSVITVSAGAVFTGSPLHDDFMRLEIWDDNAGTPNSALSVGTFFSALSTAPHWMGTNFSAPTTLFPGTNYWFVWVDSGGSNVPEEPGGVALPRRTRNANNAWGAVNTTAGTIKFRLFCNQLDDLNVSVFGNGCGTSSGALASAFTNTPPTDGNSGFGFSATNLPPGAAAFLMLGFDPNAVSTPLGPLFPTGCALNTDIVVAVPGNTGTAQIGDQPTSPRPVPFGFVRFPLAIPSGSVGVFLAAQVFAFDSGSSAPIPLVGTNAVRITVY
ncbi:MAG: hypothetical protein U1F36_13430 [Planctomycetota bacterium]